SPPTTSRPKQMSGFRNNRSCRPAHCEASGPQAATMTLRILLDGLYARSGYSIKWIFTGCSAVPLLTSLTVTVMSFPMRSSAFSCELSGSIVLLISRLIFVSPCRLRVRPAQSLEARQLADRTQRLTVEYRLLL